MVERFLDLSESSCGGKASTEWKDYVFRTHGAKAVTVWSMRLMSDLEQTDLGTQIQQA